MIRGKGVGGCGSAVLKIAENFLVGYEMLDECFINFGIGAFQGELRLSLGIGFLEQSLCPFLIERGEIGVAADIVIIVQTAAGRQGKWIVYGMRGQNPIVIHQKVIIAEPPVRLIRGGVRSSGLFRQAIGSVSPCRIHMVPFSAA